MNELMDPVGSEHFVPQAGARTRRRRILQAAAFFLLIGGQVVAFLVVRGRSSTEVDLSTQGIAAASAAAAAPSLSRLAEPLPVAEARITYAASNEAGANEDDEATAEGKPKARAAAPVPAKPTRVAVSVQPDDATILLDGAAVSAGALATVAPGAHTVVVRREGYAPTSVPFDAPVGKTVNLAIELKPVPKAVAETMTSTTATAAPAAPLPAATTTAAPAPRAAAKPASEARTPRVASNVKGSARKGKKVVRRGCSRCHPVSASMYSRAQWSRFFASGRHDRYQRLGEKVSAGELAAAKAYLMKHAADAERDQGAGVR